ncbi:Mediator of RNA polymerase II transcription subunit 15a [Raphanus sativus]|uniref:Mediator of RNA polymerase II transcription subunit 15a n=2 Tax=Raphanus sativus TaxID=3726 RepID=A0A6J0KT54_RAPSA|nr:mediator of RNA polymerase II transcription subunit 15a [Raphanus sativus]KAJ4879359.1 Mediator of RNA polymerase II transcription subunit 15a [Raphanus sativus]
MDNNNWRPSLPNGDPAMETGDWRAQLPPDSRQKIVNKIMETLKKHLPYSGPEGINELRRIAARFEEKIFSGAVNQTDYLRKISMKMLTMETKSQNAAGSSSSIPAANNGTSMDSMPTNQGNLLPGTLPNNQSQAPQPLLPQTMQNNTASGMMGSSALPSSMPPVSSITHNNNVTNVVNQNSNMQNVAGMLQDSSGQHGLSSNNMYSGSQRQMMGRPHDMSSQQQQQQQQQQQPQSAQYLYQQQLQQQLLKQNFQSGNVPNPSSLLPSHMQQQQQQQNVLQPNQMHSSQQSGIPTSATQPSSVSSAPLQGLHTNQQSSPQLPGQQTTTQAMLRQHQSSLLRQHPQSQQASGIHQQQTSLPQQSISPLQQQQSQMIRQQAANSSGIQQKQMMGQHLVGDMQQQHQQRLLNQQNNMMNMQQQQTQQQPLQQKQQPPAQQLINQQNSLQATHQQPLGTQSNVTGLQQSNVTGLQQPQQQLLNSQVGNSNLQANQQSVHMLSQPTGMQRTHQAGHGMFPSQGQQSQNQPSQQQMMPLQSHHQLGLQQQPNLLQQDVQQRLQSSGQVTGSLLPPQNVVDHQRQLYQSQRALPEMPSSSLDSTAQTENANGVDWQEEAFQKIKTMKEAYLPDLNEIYQRVTAKLQQDSLPQQQRSEQFEKLKQFKTMLERMIQFLSVSKSNIVPALKDKVTFYEKQIITFLNMHRPRKPVQQGQLPQSQMQPMQQQQSQNVQDQSHDSQTNPQMQSMSMPGSSGQRAQQSSLTNMQNSLLSSRPGVSAPQQNIPSSIPASSLESGQGNALNNGQQIALGSMQQNTPQQVNNSSVSTQSGLSTLQSNVNQTQLSSSLLQQQHMKQQQDQQMTQQFKQQLQQRQMQQQQQLLQKQQIIQQQLQARQQGAQNDMNDSTARQGMNVGRGMFQQHSLQGQRANYPLQQLKPGSQLPVTSPQLMQGASPQMIQQHMSPQIDQKNVMSSVNKMGTPLQPANSPFIVPSPSTPLAPSPMQVNSEKPSGASSLSMGNTARHQATGMQGVVQSLAIGTPGISASPLLQEFDGNNLNPLISTSGKPSGTELPMERLIRVVKSISPQALSSAVSDIGSVVSMVDRIAGSAPGNGSRASVGEDLVAMTKCRLQARNFMTQEGMMATKKMKRHTTAMPLSVSSLEGSVGDNYKQFACSGTSDLESTATSDGKKARTETEHALLEEIKEINQRLIDTVVEISDDEDGADLSEGATARKGCEGTTVKFSFIAVSLSPALKAHLSSTQMSPIQPLRLLVPCSYPNGSPSLLDKLPVETSKENEDLSSKAMARFNILLRSLSQPMSLKDIAKTWDSCARTVICEYAQQFGGGTFSSKYGTWEKYVAAS